MYRKSSADDGVNTSSVINLVAVITLVTGQILGEIKAAPVIMARARARINGHELTSNVAVVRRTLETIFHFKRTLSFTRVGVTLSRSLW